MKDTQNLKYTFQKPRKARKNLTTEFCKLAWLYADNNWFYTLYRNILCSKLKASSKTIQSKSDIAELHQFSSSSNTLNTIDELTNSSQP